MAICKIFFLLALCIWCGTCDVFYKGVGDEVSMECGVDSYAKGSIIEWKFKNELIYRFSSRSGNRQRGSSQITAKSNMQGETLKVSKLETRDAGEYVCIKSDKLKTHTLRVVSVSVKPGPVLLQSSDADLHCDITGDPDTEVQWLRPNGEKYNMKKQVISLKPVTSQDAGRWTCVVNHGFSVTLTVFVVGLQTTAVTVSKGDDIKLPCSLPQRVSQRVVGGKWKADHLPTVSFPTLTNTDKGLHWNGKKSSKVSFTNEQLGTNFDVTLHNVQGSDAGMFVCKVEFEGGVSLSVDMTLTVVDKPSGGGSLFNPQSEITKIIAEILGLAVPSICGSADAPDQTLLKLKKLKRCVDDAGANPSDTSSNVSSQDISGFAHSIASEDDIESLERKKLNLQIKLLEIQNEYYTLQVKTLKNSQ